MSLFTPMTGLLGGTLIGGSAGILLVLNGDIMGISGILNNTVLNPWKTLRDHNAHWRWVWIASFCMAVNLYVNYLTPEVALHDARSQASDVPKPSIIAMLLGGFFVGMGTRIGNGCTTGHGICGISRLSRRSLVATCSFTACAIATRFIISPLRSWATKTDFLRSSALPKVSPLASALFMGAVCLAAMVRPMMPPRMILNLSSKQQQLQDQEEVEQVEQEIVASSRKSIGAALSGITFAFGLAVSGMTKNSKVHDFLCMSGLANETYDPTLMTVMASGILASWISYQFVDGFSRTRSSDQLLTCPVALPNGCSFAAVPTSQTIDARLLIGTSIFGLGWGLTGICPGPALYAAAAGVVDAIVAWLPGFFLGSSLGLQLIERGVFETVTPSKQPSKPESKPKTQ